MSLYATQRPFSSVAYNFAAGNVRLSPNFRLGEFACHDGSACVLVHPVLIAMLEKIRAHFGGPVTINSGYRTAMYNKSIGGSPDSQHLWGMAADIVVRHASPLEVATYASDRLNAGGVGRYATFTHVDVRSGHARWIR